MFLKIPVVTSCVNPVFQLLEAEPLIDGRKLPMAPLFAISEFSISNSDCFTEILFSIA